VFTAARTRTALLLAIAGIAARAETLDAVLARMDAAARQFQSFSARVKRTDFTAAIQDYETMNGVVRMRRAKNGVQGEMDFSDPDPHTISFAGRTMEIFHPKANVVEIYDTSKFTAVIDQYLLLGFGTTGAELTKSYNLKLGGPETIGGTSTTRIELTPKSADALKYISKIELWIPDGQSNPVQEKITTPSKDTKLVVYSDLQVNPPLPDAVFELKLPSGVTKLTPQK